MGNQRNRRPTEQIDGWIEDLRRGMTQAQIARRDGTTQGTVSRYVIRRRAALSGTTPVVRRLASDDRPDWSYPDEITMAEVRRARAEMEQARKSGDVW